MSTELQRLRAANKKATALVKELTELDFDIEEPHLWRQAVNVENGLQEYLKALEGRIHKSDKR